MRRYEENTNIEGTAVGAVGAGAVGGLAGVRTTHQARTDRVLHSPVIPCRAARYP